MFNLVKRVVNRYNPIITPKQRLLNACQIGDATYVESILQDASFDMATYDNDTLTEALNLARQNGHKEVVKILYLSRKMDMLSNVTALRFFCCDILHTLGRKMSEYLATPTPVVAGPMPGAFPEPVVVQEEETVDEDDLSASNDDKEPVRNAAIRRRK